jgi:hypothetical protein
VGTPTYEELMPSKDLQSMVSFVVIAYDEVPSIALATSSSRSGLTASGLTARCTSSDPDLAC